LPSLHPRPSHANIRALERVLFILRESGEVDGVGGAIPAEVC
jgi:hypothetical protein